MILLFILYLTVIVIDIDNNWVYLIPKVLGILRAHINCQERKRAKQRVRIGKQWKEKYGKAKWSRVVRAVECQTKPGRSFYWIRKSLNQLEYTDSSRRKLIGGRFIHLSAECMREPGVGEANQETYGVVTVLWGIPSTCCLKAVSWEHSWHLWISVSVSMVPETPREPLA